MSVNCAAFAEEIKFGRMVVPRLSRIDVGISKRNSLLKVDNLVLGLRLVVINGLGSERPLRSEYSSSRLAWASAVSASRDSSYL